MMLCAVHQIALLASLCVVCAIIIAGICTVSVLLAKQSARRKKIMQSDDYMRESDIKTVDCANTHKKLRGKGKYKKRRQKCDGEAGEEIKNETKD